MAVKSLLFTPPQEKSQEDSGKAYFKTIELGDSATEKAVTSTRELEIQVLEKALESGLERTLAHIVVMVGILLSTAVAPYTSLEFEKSNAVQLESYAMLLAVGTGVAALLSSATYITNEQESLKLLRRLQERLIKTPGIEPPNQHFNPYDLILHGFSDCIYSEKDGKSQQISISFRDVLTLPL